VNISEYISNSKNDLENLLSHCSSILLVKEGELIMQYDLQDPFKMLNIEGVVSIMHTINLFSEKQVYNTLRQIELQKIRILFSNINDYTFGLLLEKGKEDLNFDNSTFRLFNILYSILRGIFSMSKPSTDLEVAASIIAVDLYLKREMGIISYTSFKTSSLLSTVEKIISRLPTINYNELKEFDIDETMSSINLELFLEELHFEIPEIVGAGIYAIDETFNIQFSRWGQISEKHQKRIMETYLENAKDFINLSNELDKRLIFEIEENLLFFHTISNTSGIFMLVKNSVDQERVYKIIATFTSVLLEIFPDKVLVR